MYICRNGGGGEMEEGKFHITGIINLPVFSSVLLNDSKVADLHGPLATRHPQIILWRPAGVGDHIGDKQLDLSCFLHIQQDPDHLLFDRFSRFVQCWLQLSQTFGSLCERTKKRE